MTTDEATAPLPVLPPGPPEPRRRHPVARVFGALVGWPATAIAALALVLRHLDTDHQSLIVLASGAYVFAPLALAGLGLALWRRALVAVGVAVLVIAAQVAAFGPVFVGETAPPAAATVTVLTQNLLYGSADEARVVARIRAADADVFLAQELTPRSVAAFRSAGLDALLPYSVLDARAGADGTGLWSRYPLGDRQRLRSSTQVPGVAATADVGDGVRLTLVTLHPSSPFPGDPSEWYRDLGRTRDILAGLPAGPVLGGGDFNATLEHARFRALLTDGWRDGAEQAGAGWLRTWPSNKGVPALVGIDHVLTRGTVATAVHPVPAPGSDHLGLIATVVVPR